jgi:hypothetical protein
MNEGFLYDNVKGNNNKTSDTAPFGISFLTSVDTLVALAFGVSLDNRDGFEYISTSKNCKRYKAKRTYVRGMYQKREVEVFSCPAIIIKDGSITTLKIKVLPAEFEPESTFFQWIPGSLWLAPIFGGSVLYTRKIEVDLENPPLQVPNKEQIHNKGKEISNANIDSSRWSDNQGFHSWNDAKEKCESIGMRLPTTEDLSAAYKTGIAKEWIKAYYWSSEEYSTFSAFSFKPKGSFVSADLKLYNYLVRCIR